MIAYIDSSVVLRVVLGQPGRLAEWTSLEHGVSSALLEVECLRTLDRFRVAHHLSEADLARRRAAVYQILEELDLVEITSSILSRASQPMPVSLGTLDAIHMATALLWRDQFGRDLPIATHDRDLARAAEAFGFSVLGSVS